ncbi:MAG TPA: hypothetical protein VFP36_08225 [Usitatibacter sp.]|nr:hypothetical protein [Usitatibacter sp.]
MLSFTKRPPALLAATMVLVLGAAAGFAHADDGRDAAACKQARDAAWFTRQLQRTDGDVDPRVPEPRECMKDRASAQATADDAMPTPKRETLTGDVASR